MIQRRVDRHESKSGHERWLVSYSDFVTLLFAFFVVMYSVSHLNQQKYELLSTTLSDAFNGKVAVDPVDLITIENHPEVIPDETKVIPPPIEIPPTVEVPETEVLAEKLQKSLNKLVDPEDLTITATEDWVEINVNANLLFESGRAKPSTEAEMIFNKVAAVLLNVPNLVEVAGYTDNRPIETAQFASNWELSAARASSVVRLLADAGMTPGRLSAVGYGEFRPVADNHSDEGRSRNRRVTVRVARHTDTPPPELPVRSFKLSHLVDDAPATLNSQPIIPAAEPAPTKLNEAEIKPVDATP